MKTLVSVVIPVYNTVNQLARCIDSVLSQTCKDVEIITVDDGSSDGSYELCSEYASKHENIRALRMEKNGGPALARNAGIDAAHGEWLLFLDSDDIITPDCVQMLLAMARDDVDIVLCGYKVYEPKESKIYKVCMEEKAYTAVEALGLLYSVIPLHFYSCIGNKLYRISTLNQYGVRMNPTLRSGNDLAFSISALEASLKLGVERGDVRYVAYQDAALYEYIKREGSITRSYRRNMFQFWGGTRTRIRCMLEKNGLFEEKKELYFNERSVVIQKAVMQEVMFRKGYKAYVTALQAARADAQTKQVLDCALHNAKNGLPKRLMFRLIRDGRVKSLYVLLYVVCLAKRIVEPQCG